MFSNIYDYAEIAYEKPYVDGPDAGEDEPDNVPEENPEGDLPGADPTGGATVVSYGGKTIALVGSGKTNVLVCMGKMMKANVEVKGGGAAAAKLQTKTFTANGTYPPDSGYDGFSKVTVDVAGKVLPKYDGEVIIEGEPESGGDGGGSAEFNIAYGDTAPEDTTKLWIKGKKGETVAKTNIDFTLNAKSVAQFPIHLYDGAFASLGEYIYIFGGTNKTTNSIVSTIYRYNIATKETVTLTPNGTAFPSRTGAAAASIVDGKIYVFGGKTTGAGTTYYNTIYCYTIATNTLEKLSTTLPKSMDSMTSQAVGTDIYIFGGNAQGTRNDVIYKFDTTNNTIVDTTAVLYTPAFGLSSARLPNDEILVFGGYDNLKNIFTISKYNATTNECKTTFDCIGLANGRSVANGYMVFLSTNTGIAYIYNARTSTLKQYNVEEYSARLGHTALYNNKAYIVSSYHQQDVVEFEETFALENSQYCIELGSAGYEVNLCGNTYANVLRVFVGNADGKAQIAEAYVYDTTKQMWVEV